MSGRGFGDEFRQTLRNCVWLMAISVAMGSTGAHAQSLESASIGGRVTDSTGGALPGVTVIATSPALQVPQMSVTTDGSGAYLLRALPTGIYRVAYELAGFQTSVRENLRLN